MGIRDRVKEKTAGLAAAVEVRVQSADKGTPASLRKIGTMPGALGAFRIEAQAYADEIERLKSLVDKLPTRMVPLDKLVEAPGRKRLLSAEAYAELRDNLAHNDLYTPIIVKSLEDGNFEIVAGHNRAQAFRDLGRTEIEAHVKDMGVNDTVRAAFYTNLLAPSLTDFEKYLGFKALIEATGMSQSDVAADAGLAKSEVSRLMNFDLLPPDALLAIASNPRCIGATAAAQMAAVAEEGDPAKVVEAIRQLASDPNLSQQSAVKLASFGNKPAKPKQDVLRTTIKSGRKTFCEIQVRSKTLGLTFADPAVAGEWRDKIEEFIRSNVAEDGK